VNCGKGGEFESFVVIRSTRGLQIVSHLVSQLHTSLGALEDEGRLREGKEKDSKRTAGTFQPNTFSVSLLGLLFLPHEGYETFGRMIIDLNSLERFRNDDTLADAMGK
jgi:hypothetical protein